MDFDRKIITHSPSETEAVGREVADYLKGHSQKFNTICLFGDLGSGKTTLVKGAADAFGIKQRIISPTFIIVRHYKISIRYKFLYHMDLYRLTDEKSLIIAGIPDILINPDLLVFIEWAENLGNMLPDKRLDIRFSGLPGGNHRIIIKKYG